MIITKALKYGTFTWNDDHKSLDIEMKNGEELTLNKVYSFALMRFMIRLSQRNWFRRKK